MKYRNFSDLGWNVSEIGLGVGKSAGTGVMFQTKPECFKRALDKGVNFLILQILMAMEGVKNFYQKLSNLLKIKYM